MNYKEKIEEILGDYEVLFRPKVEVGYIRPEELKQPKHVLTGELTALYEQAQRDAVEGFVKRVKPLLNTVTSQETLQTIADTYLSETLESEEDTKN